MERVRPLLFARFSPRACGSSPGSDSPEDQAEAAGQITSTSKNQTEEPDDKTRSANHNHSANSPRIEASWRESSSLCMWVRCCDGAPLSSCLLSASRAAGAGFTTHSLVAREGAPASCETPAASAIATVRRTDRRDKTNGGSAGLLEAPGSARGVCAPRGSLCCVTPA
ncbi:hypothetical protein AAFF_G00220360 [Aldrovandia affinis]|uniref:Uncharacterized protein n=1 Tax=Aldrovandia affinis TaxID=143900 RepID=A0AAD7QZY0_9TELE|nr:hypothetical protein AAFF_G00220360 [Aldrovandia affinis]